MSQKKPDSEWKEILTTEQFHIMRQKGTEPPNSGKYNHLFDDGIYRCSACGRELFDSKNKYDSGSGWPSFDATITESVELNIDTTLNMQRIEVVCAECEGHLGHLFSDGPKTTGQRYCVNSASLAFEPRKQEKTELETATFAAGCFWGIEDSLSKIPGVVDAVSGYIGGDIKDPTYEMVCTGTTGHAEAVQITFNPAVISYNKLVEIFFSIHNPTQLNRQGPDVGTQYRSAIFYHTDKQKNVAENTIKTLQKSLPNIVTEIVAAQLFFLAEEFHQKYYRKHGGTCHI
ncbi:bifunctional methionine sulfoxide reductase B/A protein [bacterium]|nr:bifunctional methionine sulfoxide reductase B/A protein [bacterium]